MAEDRDVVGRSRLPETITALAGLLTAIVGAATAVVALYRAGDASHLAQQAGQAAASADVGVNQLERRTAAAPGAAPAPAPGDLLVVQLASYLTANCDVAQQEINSYRGQFSPAPTLWRSPSGRYVVIGVKAADRDQAATVQAKARDLGQRPPYSVNDLANARTRVNPGWEPLASCAAI